MKQIPIPERFHLGGVPLFRGIDLKEFSQKYQEIPLGNDFFLSISLQSSQHLFPQMGLNCHFFLNGSIAANFFQTDFNFEKILHAFALGCGLTFRPGPFQIEANLQIPLKLSPNLHFLHYQIGFLPSI